MTTVVLVAAVLLGLGIAFVAWLGEAMTTHGRRSRAGRRATIAGIVFALLALGALVAHVTSVP